MITLTKTRPEAEFDGMGWTGGTGGTGGTVIKSVLQCSSNFVSIKYMSASTYTYEPVRHEPARRTELVHVVLDRFLS